MDAQYEYGHGLCDYGRRRISNTKSTLHTRSFWFIALRVNVKRIMMPDKTLIKRLYKMIPVKSNIAQVESNRIELNRTEKDDIMSIRWIRSIVLPQGMREGILRVFCVDVMWNVHENRVYWIYEKWVCTWSRYTSPNIEWLLPSSNFISCFLHELFCVQLSRLQC